MSMMCVPQERTVAPEGVPLGGFARREACRQVFGGGEETDAERDAVELRAREHGRSTLPTMRN